MTMQTYGADGSTESSRYTVSEIADYTLRVWHTHSASWNRDRMRLPRDIARIKHKSSTNRARIEHESSTDRARIEHESSTDRARIEHESSTYPVGVTADPRKCFRARSGSRSLRWIPKSGARYRGHEHHSKLKCSIRWPNRPTG